MKSFHKDLGVKPMNKRVPKGGYPMWPATPPMRGPKNGSYPSMSSPRSFGAKPQKVAFHKVTIKLIFTIHDDIFQRPFELKIFVWD